MIARQLFNENTVIKHGPDRPGDIRSSLADITETTTILGYSNPITFDAGMKEFIGSY